MNVKKIRQDEHDLQDKKTQKINYKININPVNLVNPVTKITLINYIYK